MGASSIARLTSLYALILSKLNNVLEVPRYDGVGPCDGGCGDVRGVVHPFPGDDPGGEVSIPQVQHRLGKGGRLDRSLRASCRTIVELPAGLARLAPGPPRR